MILTIAFPSKGVCNPAFAHALRLLQIGKPFKSFEVLYVEGADVAVARNKLVAAAKGDYILFLDDDVLPPPDALTKLLRHKKDFVSGLYFSRQRPHYPQIHMVNKEDPRRCDSVIDYEKDKLIQVEACGGGCMLIKRKVFKKLKRPYFHYIPADEESGIKKSEDYYFCEKVREAGFKIYCDTSIICNHIGVKFIGPEYWEISKQKIDEIEAMMGPKKFEEYKKNVSKLRDIQVNKVHK